jgi:hypothetical protein
MNNIDLTRPVMERVVSFESHRSKRERLLIYIVIFIILSAVIGAVIMIINFIATSGTLDLFTLFGEDMEIISEYWQDTLNTVWSELPQRLIISGLLLAVFMILFILATGGRRRLIKRKIANIRKYRDNKKEEI